MADWNTFQIISHLANDEEVDRQLVCGHLAHLGNLVVELTKQRDEMKAQLVEARSASAAHQIAAKSNRALYESAESQCNEQHALLKRAKASLLDWVTYNDNKKNADITPASKQLIKELP